MFGIAEPATAVPAWIPDTLPLASLAHEAGNDEGLEGLPLNTNVGDWKRRVSGIHSGTVVNRAVMKAGPRGLMPGRRGRKRVVAPSVPSLDSLTKRRGENAMELDNKTIIITGASSGIGAAAATLFAAEGANLVLGARRLAELSARTGVPVAQVAVAWVLKDTRVDTVLIGARTQAHIDSAVAAARVEFPAEWDDALRVPTQA